MENYYTLLGVSPETKLADIRKAFRREAKSCHPDLYQQAPEKERQRQQLKFVRLTQAYETLADPQKRQIYDRQFRKAKTKSRPQPDQKTRTSSSSSSTQRTYRQKSGYSDRPAEPSAQPEESLEDLLRDVEDLLGQFGLSFRDPLEMLVEWARRIFQEVIEAWKDETTGQEEIKKPKQKFSSQTKAASHTDPLDDIEAELQRLKRQSKRNRTSRNGRSGQTSTHFKQGDTKIEQELQRLKKKYRL